MRRSLRALVAILWFGAAGAVGCGPPGSLGNDTVQKALAEAGGSGMGNPTPLLLTHDDLTGINGLRVGMLELPGPVVPAPGAPDPTAPCGAPTPELHPDPRAVRVLSTADGRMYIVQALFDLPTGVAQQVIDANRADLRPGCRPVRSVPPTPDLVRSFDQEAVLYDTTGDDGVAFTSTITDADGMTWYTATSLVRIEHVLMFLRAVSTEPIYGMRELTLRAAQKVEEFR